MDIHSRLIGIHAEKDANSAIVSCNDIFLQYAGAKSDDKVLGKTDEDLPWYEYASIYRQHELDALSGNSYSTLIPLKDFEGNNLLFLHTKIAKLDQNGNKVGIICYSHEILNPGIYKMISMLSQMGIDKMPVYSLSRNLPDIDLTLREEQCLFYLVYGKTAKAIGSILGISPKTVECHMEKIKAKMNCRTKMELIEKAIHKGLLSNIPKGINIV